MDDNLDLINRAWRRVSAVDECCDSDFSYSACENNHTSGSTDADMLRDFIKDELYSAAYYEALACRTSSQNAKGTFRRIASDERTHAKKLQTEYFLLMCDTCHAPVSKPCVPSIMCALRERYIAEKKSAEAYTLAASKTANAEFAAIFTHFAQCELYHSEELKALLQCMIN